MTCTSRISFTIAFVSFLFSGISSTATTRPLLDHEIIENLNPDQDIVQQLYETLTTSNRCDIPILEGKLSSRQFRLKYWNKSPVIIRNAAKNWPGATKWTKEYLIDQFGEIRTQYGTSQGIIKNGGQGNEWIDFGDYVENVWGEKECAEDPKWCPVNSKNQSHLGEEKYLFDRENFMKQAALNGINMDMNFPAFFRTSEIASERYAEQSKRQVDEMLGGGGQLRQQPRDGNGPDGTGGGREKHSTISTVYMFLTPKYERLVGVGLHQHTDGWNAQVAGEGSKLWFMYPPQVRPGPEHPVRRTWCCGEDSWVRHYLPKLLADKTHGPGNLKPLLCTQQTGDIVYIPEWWTHGTLSGQGPTGKSGLVGVASQLVEPSGELRALYQARSLLRQSQEMKDSRVTNLARNMLRDHVKTQSISSQSSQVDLLNSLMEDLYKMEEEGTSSLSMVEKEEYKEALDLVDSMLKYNKKNGVNHAHASKLANFRNDSSTSLFHIRSGKCGYCSFS